MQFSLIMATIKRREEVGCMMESLTRQTHRSFELIVVDQNEDDRLSSLVTSYSGSFPIVHLRCKPGLSRSRNVGLDSAKGNLVSFPDDDCLYPPDLLARVSDWMHGHPDYAGLSGRSVDKMGASTVSLFDHMSGEIDKQNIWKRMTSIGLFLRWNDYTRLVRFSEELGVGSVAGYGAAEDIDFPLRILSMGLALYYDPTFGVQHPPVTTIFDQASARRAYLYGGGTGRVLKLHDYPWRSKARALLRPLGGSVLSIVTARPAKAHYHWMLFRGRLRGMRN